MARHLRDDSVEGTTLGGQVGLLHHQLNLLLKREECLMKSLWTKGLLSVALLTCVAVAPAGAGLIDRGNGLIFDDDLNVTCIPG